MINNGLVHMVSTIICNLMSSEAEANIVALYLNAKFGVFIWNLLEEMGRPQPEMPLQTNNSTAEVIVNRTIFQRCSKAMDMSSYWLRNRENLKDSILLVPRITKSRGLSHKTPPGGALSRHL